MKCCKQKTKILETEYYACKKTIDSTKKYTTKYKKTPANLAIFNMTTEKNPLKGHIFQGIRPYVSFICIQYMSVNRLTERSPLPDVRWTRRSAG